MEHGEDNPASKLGKKTVKMRHTKNVYFKTTHLLKKSSWSENKVLEAGLSEWVYYRLIICYSIRTLAHNIIIQCHNREKNLMREIGKVVGTLADPKWYTSKRGRLKKLCYYSTKQYHLYQVLIFNDN